MFSRDPAFTAGLAAAGCSVVETAYPGVGLTRLDGRMQQEWAVTARQYHVDVTIVMLGSWDVAGKASTAPTRTDRSSIVHSRRSRAAHGKVLWLSVLPGGGKNDRVLDHFYAELADRHPGEVEYLDIASALRAEDGSTPRASSTGGCCVSSTGGTCVRTAPRRSCTRR